MKCKIVMFVRNLVIPMEGGLSVFEAEYRSKLYKKKNSQAIFKVINEENGDIEAEI